MAHDWKTTTFSSVEHAFQKFTELQGKGWLCRGQPKPYNNILPSIDREPRESLSRQEKLLLERSRIDIFRSTARFFADDGEKNAMTDDVCTLMVLRHYGVPTRLLDSSHSPYVAAYFSAEMHEAKDGEIWTFNEPLYENERHGPGPEQWRKWPETTTDGSGDGTKFTWKSAFAVDEPRPWFTCNFYPQGLPRQRSQAGAYTMTARLGIDHAVAIADLFGKPSSHYQRYLVPAGLKADLRKLLRENHGIWRGSLFPDSAGATQTASKVFWGRGCLT